MPDNWKGVAPRYAQIDDKVVRMGAIAATHLTEPINFVIAGKLDKVTIDEYEDFLGSVKQ